MTAEYKSLRIERHEGIVEVVLCGPGKGNAMGPDLFRELPLCFGALDKDAAVRVVLLRGSGDNFCYGLDLMGMMPVLAPLVAGAGGAGERTQLLDMLTDLQTAVDSVARCRKPAVAAIHGWCVGGGLDLAAACDVRLCSADAKFSLNGRDHVARLGPQRFVSVNSPDGSVSTPYRRGSRLKPWIPPPNRSPGTPGQVVPAPGR